MIYLNQSKLQTKKLIDNFDEISLIFVVKNQNGILLRVYF
jgi:hypothetical protein